MQEIPESEVMVMTIRKIVAVLLQSMAVLLTLPAANGLQVSVAVVLINHYLVERLRSMVELSMLPAETMAQVLAAVTLLKVLL